LLPHSEKRRRDLCVEDVSRRHAGAAEEDLEVLGGAVEDFLDRRIGEQLDERAQVGVARERIDDARLLARRRLNET
jgi:hypothetical protein